MNLEQIKIGSTYKIKEGFMNVCSNLKCLQPQHLYPINKSLSKDGNLERGDVIVNMDGKEITILAVFEEGIACDFYGIVFVISWSQLEIQVKDYNWHLKTTPKEVTDE